MDNTTHLNFLCVWVFSLLKKNLTFLFLFAITAAGVVSCGCNKKSSRTSSILQITFYFWSFEINGNILRILNSLYLEPYTRQYFAFWPNFRML